MWIWQNARTGASRRDQTLVGVCRGHIYLAIAKSEIIAAQNVTTQCNIQIFCCWNVTTWSAFMVCCCHLVSSSEILPHKVTFLIKLQYCDVCRAYYSDQYLSFYWRSNQTFNIWQQLTEHLKHHTPTKCANSLAQIANFILKPMSITDTSSTFCCELPHIQWGMDTTITCSKLCYIMV